jgi:hypothetical protein
MRTTAHRLTSLWTTVSTQLRDTRDARAAVEPELVSSSTPEGFNYLSNVLGHRI